MNEQSNTLAEDVMPEVGEVENAVDQDGNGDLSESEAIKKRLGVQKKKHNRELRALQDQVAQQSMVISQMQQQLSQNAPGNDQNMQNQQQPPMQYDPRDIAEMHKIEDEFNQDLLKTADKYEDFDDIVRDPHAPFTASIREIAKTLDNPGEVIYSLGKNRDELYRIKDLPPHRQAKEIYKLSKALSLKEKTASGTMQPKTMTPLKGDASTIKSSSSTPSVGDFRKMLRSGRK